MAGKSATKRSQNGERTITLPILEDQYAEIIRDAKRFRNEWLDPFPWIARNCFQWVSRRATQ